MYDHDNYITNVYITIRKGRNKWERRVYLFVCVLVFRLLSKAHLQKHCPFRPTAYRIGRRSKLHTKHRPFTTVSKLLYNTKLMVLSGWFVTVGTPYSNEDTERCTKTRRRASIQALADISRSGYVVITTKPVHRLQIRLIVHN